MSFSRVLTFRSDSTIVNPVTIMLTFDPVTAVPPLTQVAWRILDFGGPNQFATVTYQQNLMFASIQVDQEQEITAEADIAIAIGQQTSLIPSGDAYQFTTPTAGIAGELVATNKTGAVQALAIGFLDSNNFPHPLLVWPRVGNTNSVEAQFTPILSAYATSDYQQTQLITGQIVSPVLLKQNLALLPSTRLYTLSMKPDGSYNIAADTQVAEPLRLKIAFNPRFDDYQVGSPFCISVRNNLGTTIQVMVGSLTNPGVSEGFYTVQPGVTREWERKGAEVISVNVGGVGRVATFYGIVGKTLHINPA